MHFPNSTDMRYSIITINYNNKDGLLKTIASVVSQSYKDFEYIVIDGGSTDGSAEVIKDHSKHIDYWVSEQDRGIYHAMNKGIAQANGEYCLFLNSGDCFYNNNVLENVSRQNCNEDIFVGKVVATENKQQVFLPPLREISLYYLYSGTLPHQGAFIKTEFQKKYLYDESLKITSDWKFFVQAIIIDNCSFRYIDEFVSQFDMEGISTSNPERTWKEKKQVLFELFPPRVLADYRLMKDSECMTQTLTPKLRARYSIDKLLYNLGTLLLKIKKS